jgi:hypothetical protein
MENSYGIARHSVSRVNRGAGRHDVNDRQLAAVPTLADIQAERVLLDRLSVDTLVDLRRQLHHLEADLEAAIARGMMKAGHRPSPAEPDRFLSPAEAAATFAVKVRWLLAHADQIPGVRRLSKKVIRFNERALRRHLNGMKA